MENERGKGGGGRRGRGGGRGGGGRGGGRGGRRGFGIDAQVSELDPKVNESSMMNLAQCFVYLEKEEKEKRENRK